MGQDSPICCFLIVKVRDLGSQMAKMEFCFAEQPVSAAEMTD